MRLFLAFLFIALVAPARAGAWGFEAHQFIVRRAIEQLPEPMRPFFEKHREFIVAHSIDPDLWRTAGWVEEPSRHFVDLDAYGAFPFRELPREYDRAVEKFGRAMVERNGLLPWRAAETTGELRRAFAQQTRGGAPYALENVKFFSAIVAHYVSDGFVPLHAVLNYDGQLTGQHGVHARFEGELFTRYSARLTIAPPPVSSATDPRDFMFDTLLASFQLADEVFKADREVTGSRSEYDAAYFDAFLGRVQPMLERRLSQAISGVASVLIGAWEAGGRPALPLQPPEVTQKVGARPR